jgi:hypothetical protein
MASQIIPGIDVAAALARLPDIIKRVRSAMDPQWKYEVIRVNAFTAGLDPILKDAAGSDDPEYIEFAAGQALVLLEQLDEVLPQACEDISRSEHAMAGIAELQRLLGDGPALERWAERLEAAEDAQEAPRKHVGDGKGHLRIAWAAP